jgi:hypothetical protein
MMAKIQLSGSGMASPLGDENQFRRVLAPLCGTSTVEQSVAKEFYLRLGRIVEQWLSGQQRADTSPVAQMLQLIHTNLHEIERALSGHDTGLHNSNEIALVSQLEIQLSQDPAVGSMEGAREVIASFRKNAARIAHASLVAAADLTTQRGSKGRHRLDWYNDFTVLLLDIAREADIEPKLQKDRKSGIRSGWLFQAASALEAFLYPAMRSRTDEACGKRLERSKAQLKGR